MLAKRKQAERQKQKRRQSHRQRQTGVDDDSSRMLVPKKNRLAVYSHLFKGRLAAETRASHRQAAGRRAPRMACRQAGRDDDDMCGSWERRQKRRRRDEQRSGED